MALQTHDRMAFKTVFIWLSQVLVAARGIFIAACGLF